MWCWYKLKFYSKYMVSPVFLSILSFSWNGLDTIKIFSICKDNCCFYHSSASSNYGYITESWFISELSLYCEYEFSGGAILPKVTIYKPILILSRKIFQILRMALSIKNMLRIRWDDKKLMPFKMVILIFSKVLRGVKK